MDDRLEETMDQIDAAVFTGDSLYSADALERFEWYLERWRRELKNIREIVQHRQLLEEV